MIIGIDGSRAFIKKRTGIEEYSYQVVKYLRNFLENNKVVLYIKAGQEVDFDLPENWEVKKLWLPRFWTQLRLSLEMLFHAPDVLFVPSHAVPFIHPKNTVVTIHGLEYEFCSDAYSFWERIYMRWVIRKAVKWAKKVISVSENTKKDLESLYGVGSDKINVIYEGYFEKKPIIEKDSYLSVENRKIKEIFKDGRPYILFIGRIEKRKNISTMIKSFEILKNKYGASHKLILAGKPGYGYGEIAKQISKSESRHDIVELGFVSENDKWALLKRADIFLFITLYEGFGLPILEAQNAMVPVIVSNASSMPEVADDSAIMVPPDDPLYICENMNMLIQNEKAREDIVKRGSENIKRFSWMECSNKIANLLEEL